MCLVYTIYSAIIPEATRVQSLVKLTRGKRNIMFAPTYGIHVISLSHYLPIGGASSGGVWVIHLDFNLFEFRWIYHKVGPLDSQVGQLLGQLWFMIDI